MCVRICVCVCVCFLITQAQVPFFIHRRVWDQTCQPIRTSVAYSIVAGSAQRASPVSQINAGSGGGGGGSKVLDPQGAPYQRGGSGSGGGGGSSGSSGGGGGGEEWQGRAANPTASPDTLTMEEVSLLRCVLVCMCALRECVLLHHQIHSPWKKCLCMCVSVILHVCVCVRARARVCF